MTSVWKSASFTSMTVTAHRVGQVCRADHRRGRRGASAFTDDGAGVPVVLLHGLTASRRYVVMGSRSLQRAGHRVVAYDARGHGASSPAPAPRRLRLRAAGRRPRRACSTRSGSSAPCSPAPRWARTRSCASRSTSPSASPAVAVITPGYDPVGIDDRGRLARWDALSDALRRGGIDGFVEAFGGSSGCPRPGATRSRRSCASAWPARAPRRRRRRAARRRRARAPSPTSTRSSRSSARRSSSPAATRPTPATRSRSARPTPSCCRGAASLVEERGRVAAGVAGRAAVEGHRRAGRRGVTSMASAGYSGHAARAQARLQARHAGALSSTRPRASRTLLGELPDGVRVLARPAAGLDLVVLFVSGGARSSAGCRACRTGWRRRG